MNTNNSTYSSLRICLAIIFQIALWPIIAEGQTINGFSSTSFDVQESDFVIAYFTITPNLDTFDQTELTINLPTGATPTFTFYKHNGTDYIACPCAGKDISVPPAGNPRVIVILHEDGVSSNEEWKMLITGVSSSANTTGAIYTTTGNSGTSQFTAIHIQPTADAGADKSITEGNTDIEIGGDGNQVNAQNVTPSPTLSYSWLQTSGPSGPLDNPSAQKPKITSAPTVSSPETLIYELSVNDDTLTNTDTINVIVNPRQPAEITLVLDHSGSMTSENKWDNAVKAANMFLKLLQNLNSAFDTSKKDLYGLVSFSSSNFVTDLVTQAPGVTPGSNVLIDVSSFTAGQFFGLTPIGDGLQAAIDGFESLDAGSSGTDRPKYILLLTDGMENSGLLSIDQFKSNLNNPIETPNSAVRGTKIYTVGLGENKIEPDKISTLAHDTGGDYRITNDTIVLPQFFAQILGSVIGAQEIPEIGGSYMLNSGEDKAVFIVVWDRDIDGAGPFYPRVIGGGTGTNVNPMNVDSLSFATKSKQLPNDSYTFYILEDDSPTFILEGDWDFRIVDDANTEVSLTSAKKYVLVDLHLTTDFAFNKGSYVTGDDITLSATIMEGNSPVIGSTVEVYADCDIPMEGIGTLFAKTKLDWAKILKAYAVTDQKIKRQPIPKTGPQKEMEGSNLHLDDLNKRAVLTKALFQKLGKNYVDKQNSKLRLYDDGNHNDGVADDGVYANTIRNVQHEGNVTCIFSAYDKSPDTETRFARTETKSTYFGVAADTGATFFDYQFLDIVKGLQQVKIIVQPKSNAGEYLGPFYSDKILMRSSAGRFKGPLQDHYNGTYSRIIEYDKEKEIPMITIFVKDKLLKKIAIKDKGIPPYYIWILAIILILILIIVYIMRKKKSA